MDGADRIPDRRVAELTGGRDAERARPEIVPGRPDDPDRRDRDGPGMLRPPGQCPLQGPEISLRPLPAARRRLEFDPGDGPGGRGPRLAAPPVRRMDLRGPGHRRSKAPGGPSSL